MSTPRILMTWQYNLKDFLCFRLLTLYVFRLCKHMNTLYSPSSVKLFPVCSQVWITDFPITSVPIKSDIFIVKIVWHTFAKYPSSFVTHKARAMVIISPHGFSISPILPKPECSTEKNIAPSSFLSSLFSRKLLRNYNGTIVFNWGCLELMAPYSRVTISRAPASKTRASTHGFLEPITNTRPLIIPGVCLRPSRNEF
jgi:hypothetical protein